MPHKTPKLDIREGSYRFADGACKKGGYKLCFRLDVGTKFSPQVIDLGLETYDKKEAKARAKMIIEYVDKINARKKPRVNIVDVALERTKETMKLADYQLELDFNSKN